MANVKWAVDPTHSEVQFKVKHLMITTVTGYLAPSTWTWKPKTTTLKQRRNIVFTADVNSISTNNEQRDTHLKSADFFDAANHDEIRFVGTKYEQTGEDTAKLHGDLTITGHDKAHNRKRGARLVLW